MISVVPAAADVDGAVLVVVEAARMSFDAVDSTFVDGIGAAAFFVDLVVVFPVAAVVDCTAMIGAEVLAASFDTVDAADSMLVDEVDAPAFLVDFVGFETSSLFLLWSNSRRRSVSHAGHSSRS